MRLIDADSFELNVQSEWERSEISSGDWMLIRQLINEEPTIDAVEVVRCKNCRKWLNGDDTYGTCQWNQYQTRQTKYDDFCSYGERK